MGSAFSVQAQTAFQNFQVAVNADDVTVSVTVGVTLAPVLLDAMSKGIPLTFLLKASVYKDRWYWINKLEATRSRYYKIVYQPLMRRWRLTTTSADEDDSPTDSSNFLSGVNQYFDHLDPILTLINRVDDWRIMKTNMLDQDARYLLKLEFLLDIDKLPRPFRVGVDGQPDWTLDVLEEKKLPWPGGKR